MAKTIITKGFTSKDFQTMIYDQLVRCNDAELLILKGHTLIEYMLNHFLDMSSNSGIDFDISRFTFSQKTHLFEILGQRTKEISDDIKVVNKLRNEIAHKLTYNKDELETLISSVLKRLTSLNKSIETTGMNGKIMSVVIYICGNLYAHIEGQKKRKEVLNDLLKNRNNS